MRNRVRLGGSSFAPLAHEIPSCQAAQTDLGRRLRPYVGCIDHDRVQQASLLTIMSVPRCQSALGDAYSCMRGIETGVGYGTIEESKRRIGLSKRIDVGQFNMKAILLL
jgi:hypothetical protein